MNQRRTFQKIKDFLTLPLRAIAVFEENKWGLSSTRHERFEYAAKEVIGYCLDVGCGKQNLFIKQYLEGNGRGIDVFPYEGLAGAEVVNDLSEFPFSDASFDSITFIANMNHIPKDMRDKELAEARRCLRKGGNVIITMPNALAGILIHKIVHTYDSIFGTHYDLDAIRGMDHDHEAYYLPDKEILERLARAGFKNIQKKYFGTQWGMNHLFVGWKQ